MIRSWVAIFSEVVADVDGEEPPVLPGVAFKGDLKRFTNG